MARYGGYEWHASSYRAFPSTEGSTPLPPSFAWTFAVTHEWGYWGPCFASA